MLWYLDLLGSKIGLANLGAILCRDIFDELP